MEEFWDVAQKESPLVEQRKWRGATNKVETSFEMSLMKSDLHAG